MPWDKFIKTLNGIAMKYFAAMEPGGKMGFMLGDVRRTGRARSMLADIVKPGKRNYEYKENKHKRDKDNESSEAAQAGLPIPDFSSVLKKNGWKDAGISGSTT